MFRKIKQIICFIGMSVFLTTAGSVLYAQKNSSMDTKQLLNQVSEKYEKQDFQGALSDIEKVIELEPSNPNHYMARGDIKEQLKDNEGAVADFRKGIELNPKNEGAYGRFAVSFYSRGEWQNAANVYSELLQLNPNNLAALLMRGNCQRELRNYEAAADDYSRYIALESNRPEGYQSRAVVRAKMGQLNQAKEDIERVGQMEFQSKSRQAFVHLSLGNFYHEYKQSADAKRYWQNALNLYQQSNDFNKEQMIEMLQRNLQHP